MKTKLLIILIIVSWSLPLLAQEVDTAWVRRYNGPGNSDDWGKAIAIDGSGNVYVTGYSYGSGTSDDYATIKYSPNGDPDTALRYNGPGNGLDWAFDIAVDGSGNFYVTGTSYGGVTSNDYATIRYSPNGDTIRYNGPGNGSDWAFAIAVDDSGNFYVTGESSDDYATIKYGPSGDTAWVRRYDGPGNAHDAAWAIAVDGSGNVYVTGGSLGDGTDHDFATIKYYPDGETAWEKRYSGPGNGRNIGRDIAVDGRGNVYVTGESDGGGTSWDYATIKYFPDGDTAWVRRYNGAGNSSDYAHAIAVDDSGNVYVTGGGGGDYTTIKYHSNGDTAWIRTYNGPGNGSDEALAITVDGSGNVYVTGGSLGSGGPFAYDYATVKYYCNGDNAWVRRYNGPEDSLDVASAIAVDDSGNVYVTGYSYGSGSDRDYATIKYYQHNDPPDPFSLLFPPNKAFTPRVVRFDWETATDPNPCDQVRYDLYVSTSYQFPPDQTTIDSNLVASEHIKTLDYGAHYWKVKAKDNWGAERWSNQIRYFMVTGVHPSPLGDFNRDGSIDIGDVVFLINYLYTSGPVPDPLELGDVNCDDGVNVGDVIFLINFLFKNGPPPSC